MSHNHLLILYRIWERVFRETFEIVDEYKIETEIIGIIQTKLKILNKSTMTKCFSFTATLDSCYRKSFTRSGLRSSSSDLGDGTVMHCWTPRCHVHTKPTLVLIHGFGANAMWQLKDCLPKFKQYFNLYVPDLLFFGDSFTTRPERSESFQAECVMRVMETHGVEKMDLMGLSYGGFVAYSMAAQYKERIGRVVLGCAGVCLEEKDIEEGMVEIKTVEEAVGLLIPQSPEKARQLSRISFYKPPQTLPSCFINDFIQEMYTEYRQEKTELIEAFYKDRRSVDVPKITHSTLIIWGEYDLIFPLELAHRLQRHIGESATLVVMKNVGHALNWERPKEFYKHMKSFLVEPHRRTKQANHSNGHED